MVSVLDFSYAYWSLVVTHLIYISLMTYDTEHLFICLFAIRIALVFSLIFKDIFTGHRILG